MSIILPPGFDAAKYAHDRMKEGLPARVRTSKYLNDKCLSCHRERDDIASRYCQMHREQWKARFEADVASGKARDKNYAFTEPGYNIGLNAWVHDRDHYRELEKLATLEGIHSIG